MLKAILNMVFILFTPMVMTGMVVVIFTSIMGYAFDVSYRDIALSGGMFLMAIIVYVGSTIYVSSVLAEQTENSI
jgi:hypothetical protein